MTTFTFRSNSKYLSSGTDPLTKGTVSPDLYGFFMTYDIKSVLSARALLFFTFFHQVVILIFLDKILMYIAQNTA
jgi:hypothetical protein